MEDFEKPEKRTQTSLSDFQKKLYTDRMQYLYQLLDNLKQENILIGDFCRTNEQCMISKEIVDILILLAQC